MERRNFLAVLFGMTVTGTAFYGSTRFADRILGKDESRAEDIITENPELDKKAAQRLAEEHNKARADALATGAMIVYATRELSSQDVTPKPSEDVTPR